MADKLFNKIPLTDGSTGVVDDTSKVKKSGDTMTGELDVPVLKASNYFVSPALIGEGDESTYYHRIDFGRAGHDYVDFHDVGGTYNFYRNMSGKKEDDELVGSIQPDGFHGNLTGNASSATKLQTAHTINGVAFDGTADITIPGLPLKWCEYGTIDRNTAKASDSYSNSVRNFGISIPIEHTDVEPDKCIVLIYILKQSSYSMIAKQIVNSMAPYDFDMDNKTGKYTIRSSISTSYSYVEKISDFSYFVIQFE